MQAQSHWGLGQNYNVGISLPEHNCIEKKEKKIRENVIQGNNRNTSSYLSRQILSCPDTTGGLTLITEHPVTFPDVPSQPRQAAL